MAELTISAADIASALKKNLEGFEPSVEARTVGRVVEVGDGIAGVSGLPDAAVNELLEFEDGSVGLALNLDQDQIGAVVLGDVDAIERFGSKSLHLTHGGTFLIVLFAHLYVGLLALLLWMLLR